MESKVLNIDCMFGMAEYPDKYFDLAVVDPPYGIARFGNRVEISNRICKNAKINEWDIKPQKEYFNELFRISKNQIIWGANNFELPPTEYFIVWDKQQTVENFASAEYAWVSIGLKKPAKIFQYSIHKTMSDRKKENGKIHPTQKPIKLYDWIYLNYLPKGGKVIDTHLGSGSNRIAADKARNIDFVGYELNKEYFEAQEKRWAEYKMQQKLF
jgi:site-specific DNA-methyltransferase (adenine-specific)